jgi:hypothetical protein
MQSARALIKVKAASGWRARIALWTALADLTYAVSLPEAYNIIGCSFLTARTEPCEDHEQGRASAAKGRTHKRT